MPSNPNKRVVIEFEMTSDWMTNEQIEKFIRQVWVPYDVDNPDQSKVRVHVLDNHAPTTASYVQTQVSLSSDQIHEDVIGVRFFDATGKQIGVCIGTCITGHDHTEEA